MTNYSDFDENETAVLTSPLTSQPKFDIKEEIKETIIR